MMYWTTLQNAAHVGERPAIMSTPRSWRRNPIRLIMLIIAGILVAAIPGRTQQPVRPVPLKSRITNVQPMTGIVLWTTSEHNRTDAIQLEYSYMKYSDVIVRRGQYDWSAMDRLLERVAARGHQAIIRFYFVYPGHKTTVPAYIKSLPDYREVESESEGKPTSFPDWSHSKLKHFMLEFYDQMGSRYDDDPRLAFVETGFGLWAEYHIYDGPMKLGKTFPDKAFQAEFVRHVSGVLRKTPWMISVDAADESRAAFRRGARAGQDPVRRVRRFVPLPPAWRENEPNWNFFGRDRWKIAPAGGEFSYYTPHDQKQALAPAGPHGISFEKAAADFHITFMIGNDQPRHQPLEHVRAAGIACGYKFRILAFESNLTSSRRHCHQHRGRSDLPRCFLGGQWRPSLTFAQGAAPKSIANR